MSSQIKLDPTATSFPFPNSSPTTSSISTPSWPTTTLSTTSSTDKLTSASGKTTSSERSKIGGCGESWVGQFNDSTLGLPDVYAPSRARSPSLPILPSQGGGRELCNAQGPTVHWDHWEPQAYQARPYPQPSLLDHLPSAVRPASRTPQTHTTDAFGSIQPISLSQPTPVFYPALSHHASTPSLGRARRGVSGHVRFRTPLREEDEDILFPDGIPNEGRRLTGSRSMSVLCIPGRGKNVYINNVPENMTKEGLERLARDFGVVYSARIQEAGEKLNGIGCAGPVARCFPYSSTPARLCGFVLFETPYQASSFIEYLKANNIPCDYAKEDFQTEWKSREDRSSSNLYIQGLPLDTNQEDILRLLQSFGQVVSHKVLDSNGIRRGPVMARMATRPEADAVISGLNGRLYPGATSALQVRIADSDGQKDFKRKASLVYSLDHPEPDLRRRASMPLDISLNSPEDVALEEEKRFYQERLAALEARSVHAYVRPCAQRLPATPRTYASSSRLANLFSPHPAYIQDSTPSRSERIPSFSDSSAYTPSLSTEPSRSASFASVASVPSNPSSIWGIQTPSRHHSQDHDGHYAKAIGAGLYHARSSPELGMGMGNPAKLLWPDSHRDLDA